MSGFGLDGNSDSPLNGGNSSDTFSTVWFHRGGSDIFLSTVANIGQAYNLPKGAVVFDPFATSEMAKACVLSGYFYVGLVHSNALVTDIEQRIGAINSSYTERITIIRKVDGHICDSYDVQRAINASIDIMITDSACFYTLWPDLYHSDYDNYRESVESAIVGTSRLLIPGALSVWLCVPMRNKKGGIDTLDFDIAELYDSYEDYIFKEEIILCSKYTSYPHMQVPGALRRVHSKCLVFKYTGK